MPDNYFSESAQEQIVLLKRNSGELEKLRFLEKLDMILKQSSPTANWFSDAERLYRNWLRLIVTERKQGVSRP